VSGVIQVPGFRCQGREKKAESCWSEAEIPSEAKRQQGTVKSETQNFASAFGGLFLRQLFRGKRKEANKVKVNA